MQKIFSKKLLFLIPIFVFLGLFLFGAHQAKAQLGDIIGGIISDAAMDILQGVFYILQQLGGLFAGFCGNLFTKITDFGFNNATSMETVRDGWTITRDIVNMFFILGLVVIAFATILRTETYGMKALLPKFIVVALLINFSYLICGIIIDASQVVVDYFTELINPEGDVDVGLQLLDTLGVQNSITSRGEVSVAISQVNPEVTTTLTMGFNAAILFVAGYVMLVGTVLLFLRVGALWILIILSPFAWFFSIFPYLQEHSKKWWSEFLKWVFFAPVYIFFIYLVLRLSQSAVFNNLTESPSIAADMTISPMLQDLNLLFQYVFLVVLLLGAPTVAMSMGIKAAGAAQTFIKGAFRGTARVAGKVGRQAERFMVKPPEWMKKKIPNFLLAGLPRTLDKFGKYISPTAWKVAIDLREKRMRRRAMEPAIGETYDVLNRLLSLGKDKTFKGQEARQRILNERISEMAIKGSEADRLIADAESAADAKMPEECAANLILLAQQKDLADEFMQHSRYGKYAYVDYLEEKAKEKYGGEWKIHLEEEFKGYGKNWEEIKENKELHNVADPFTLKRALFKILMDSGLSENDAGAYVVQASHLTFSEGEHSAYKMANFKKGKWKMSSDEEHLKVTNAKTATIAPRYTFQHGTARDFLILDQKGNVLDLHDIGIERIKKMSIKEVDEISQRFREWRDELRDRMSSDVAVQKMKEHGKKLGGEYEKVFNHLADKLENFRKGGLEPQKVTPPKPKETTKGPTEKDREEWRKKQGITE